MKRVLVIVYYFPPMGGSGVQRPLKFIKYLADFGWEPVVLCPEPGAYHTFDESLETELNRTGVEVVRVKAVTPFHVAGSRKKIRIGGIAEKVLRYISSFFWIPDNKKGWIGPAVKKANELLKEQDFDLIFASAPPYSNLLIAESLSKQSGIPFVADLRDDWAGSHLLRYPTPFHRKKMETMEEKTLTAASTITTTNPYIKDSISSRVPKLKPAVIPHGYDAEDFRVAPADRFSEEHIHFLYSGMLYPKSNADAFFGAISRLLTRKPEWKELIRLHFQGNIDESYLLKANTLGIRDLVVNHGYLDHKLAVLNLMKADILWLNNEHPKNPHLISLGKTFEYMGSGKPILAMIPDGAVKDELHQYGAAFIHQPGETEEVVNTLESLIDKWKRGSLPQPDKKYVSSLTRKEQTRKLAGLFDELM